MKKKSKVNRDVEDVAFILNEVLRFAKFTVDDWKRMWAEEPMSGFYQLQTPERNFYCGREAWLRFGEIARRLQSRQPEILRKVDFEGLTKALREEFSRTVLERYIKPDESSVAKMFSRALKELEEQFDSLTHHIPCSMFTCSEVNELFMGPVHFQKTDLFFEEKRSSLEFDKQRRIERSFATENESSEKSENEEKEKFIRREEELFEERSGPAKRSHWHIDEKSWLLRGKAPKTNQKNE